MFTALLLQLPILMRLATSPDLVLPLWLHAGVLKYLFSFEDKPSELIYPDGLTNFSSHGNMLKRLVFS